MQRNNIKLGTIDNNVEVAFLDLIGNDITMSFKIDNMYNFTPTIDLKTITIGDLKNLTLFEIYYK